MQCGSFVKYKDARRKGSGKPYMRPSPPITWWAVSDLGPFAFAERPSSADLLADGYVVCDGAVEAKVEVEYEPYFGGCSERIAVSYKCGKCGQTFFPELPGGMGCSDAGNELGDYLSGSIDALDETAADARRNAAKLYHSKRADSERPS